MSKTSACFPDSFLLFLALKMHTKATESETILFLVFPLSPLYSTLFRIVLCAIFVLSHRNTCTIASVCKIKFLCFSVCWPCGFFWLQFVYGIWLLWMLKNIIEPREKRTNCFLLVIFFFIKVDCAMCIEKERL